MASGEIFEKSVRELISPPFNFEIDYQNPPRRNGDIEMSANAKEVFNRRYRRKNEQGKYAETIAETFDRVANHLAVAEETPETQSYYRDYFYNFLSTFKFVPNSPTWTGAGTPLGQLAACFVLPLKDDMGKKEGGIFDTLKNAALIQQTGGGNGFPLSFLRPRGDVVKTSMGKASGPVSFLEVYDSAFGHIAQGGVRRGANMAVMRVNHPDIRDFITCKSKEGKVSNFNISVAITDEFMEAVREDNDFDLVNPRNDEVWETARAREIFDLIVENAHRNGEPGVLFIDEANRHNPVPHQYSLEATNPCGEQWLGPYENCCLGHINLAAHLTSDGQIDWEALAESTWMGTRFLDNVVTQNAYVDSVPQLKEAAHKNRRIGLGYMGLGDVMYELGVRYGSDEGAELAAQITEFVRYHSMLASIRLAKERGAFPGIKGSIYDPKNIKWEIPKPLREYQDDWGRPQLNWDEVTDGIKNYGIRNAAQMTVAPTGTTSSIADVEGYGCEPVFALAYERNMYQAAGDDEKVTLKYVSPRFDAALKKLDLSGKERQEIVNEVIEKGTVQGIEKLPPEIRNTFVVAGDITPGEHVLMQASIQVFIDNSISKTCNFPEEATKQDVDDAYFQAWETKCKGLTVYRQGSREEIVLETKETKRKRGDSTQAQASEVSPSVPLTSSTASYIVRPRPKVLRGETHEIQTPLGTMFMTVNRNGNEELHEVFVNVGRAGTDIMADAEALGRLISLVFRLGPRATSQQKLDAVIDQLLGIKGGLMTTFEKERVASIPDAIAKVLMRVKEPDKFAQQEKLGLTSTNPTYVSSGTPAIKDFTIGELCPECGNYTVVQTEGCKKCLLGMGGCGEYSVC